MHNTDKPTKPQHVFTVLRREQLTPHMVRIHLGGPAFDTFLESADQDRIAATDRYVKLLLPPNGSDLTPPFDLGTLRATHAKEHLPARRTYTVRTIDPNTHSIAIDFVTHGDDGLAGPWAARAKPGDLLALSGPGGGYTPTADPNIAHLIVGDDSALPAISSAVEALHPDATGTVLIEIDTALDEHPLQTPPGITLRWLHRRETHATPGTLLTAAVETLHRPTRPVRVFAHGERAAMKHIRRFLQDEWKVERHDMSLSAYWALGRAEDRFQAEKREPVGAVFPN